eukprot:Awhi_evm1s11426
MNRNKGGKNAPAPADQENVISNGATPTVPTPPSDKNESADPESSNTGTKASKDFLSKTKEWGRGSVRGKKPSKKSSFMGKSQTPSQQDINGQTVNPISPVSFE